MRRTNIFRYVLELIVVLGHLVIGVTVLTYLFQSVPIDKVFIGAILIAIGVCNFTDFFTLKRLMKIKSAQNLAISLLTIGLGVIFILLNINMDLLCILYGAFSIGFSIVKIITAALCLTHQPLLNAIKIILNIIEIIFSIFLIIRTLDFLYGHMTFIGIALVIEAFILLVEFMVHRYQRI